MCGYRCLAWGLFCWALVFANTRRRSAGKQVEVLMINRKQKVDVGTPKRLLFYFSYLIAQNITEKPKQNRYIACITTVDHSEMLCCFDNTASLCSNISITNRVRKNDKT